MGEPQTHGVEKHKVAAGAQEKGKARWGQEPGAKVLRALWAHPGGQGSWARAGEVRARTRTLGDKGQQRLLLEAGSGPGPVLLTVSESCLSTGAPVLLLSPSYR